MQSLGLEFCKFKSLNSNLFAELKNLSHLNLVGININNATENIFFHLKNLNWLSLNGIVDNKAQFLNIFSYIPDRDTLEILHISRNNLISLDGLNLNQFPKLKFLFFSENNIRQINKSDTFNGMNELIIVYLRFNEIESLDFDLFFEGNKIEEFWIDFNKIQKDEINFFKEAKILRILYISYCELSDFSQIFFLA